MATLKISDLSVGDWVRVINQFDAQIDGYHSRSGSLSLKTRQGNLVHYRLEDIESIPITAEILERNGFTRRNGEFPIYEYTTLLGKMLRKTVVSLEHSDSYFVCRIEDTSKELHDFGRTPVNIWVERSPIHIHDLQHALRLAGVDKEINL